MAQIYKEPKKEQLFNGLNQEHKDILKKMLEIQDILINNPPNDKRFNKQEFKYMLDYINILNNVQLKDYSDEYLQEAIKELHDKIFKHRRY